MKTYTVSVHPHAPFQDWRWTMRARNGRIVGAASEGYRKRSDCVRNLETVTGMSFAAVAKAHKGQGFVARFAR